MNHHRYAIRSYKDYLKSNMNDILKAYKKPSYNKKAAWNYCKSVCEAYNGFNLKIISKNSFQFTAGFEFVNSNGDFCFCYMSAKHDLWYEIPDSEVD